MSKLELSRPTLIMIYGFPGAGKTFLARQLSDDLLAANIQSDRIRSEIFEQPRYDKQEDDNVSRLTEYMVDEFLKAGLSVVLDANILGLGQRRNLRNLAQKHKVKTLIIWVQIDLESAFDRAIRRDHRKVDDRYAKKYDRTAFEYFVGRMQNPQISEDYVVISGKHNYQTQRAAIVKRLYDLGLIQTKTATDKLIKPGLVNLVPNINGGRVDSTRRNISIR
ncbi:MAG TPA: ATP-binding protein [Candidatus Saccharimonadales bacterium]|nr:ATP-binding protein [Candidatus Saccharimonadales bacterium]